MNPLGRFGTIMVTPFFSTASRRILPALCILALLMAAPALALTLSPGGTASGTISNGDPVYINGIATGHPQAGLQIWIIGPNYVKVATTQVNNDNTYSYELRPADTQNLAPGQYVVLVQHPMMNGRLDITYDAATGKVTNQMTGAGTSIFSLTGAGSLQNPNAALALMEAISSPDIDDTFAQVAFTIRSPTAFIDPVGTHAVGDTITFQGSTNLAVNDDLSVTIYSESFQPTKKSQSGEFSGASGIVKVVPGTNGLNHWAFTADTSTWKPDKYLVTVSGVTVTVTGSTSFALLPALPATTVVAPASPTVTYLSPTGPPTTVSTPVPPTNQSPAPVMAVAGLPAVLIAIRAIRKKER
ncbi:MAG: hypothetical protein LUP97_03100 [Methanoregula sp.]|nr:hypothetical protein [Methanoregula sp.]